MGFYERLTASWRDDHPALILGDEVIDYGTLRERVARARGWLARHGLQAGDVLALQIPRDPVFLDLHLAALSTGVVTLPLNDRYTPQEVAYLLGDAQAVLGVLVESTADALDETLATPVVAASALDVHEADPAPAPEPPADGDLAVLCYTSGTTGRPKGARITHANLAATVGSLHEAWRWSAGDVLIHALPLYHVHGLFVAQHGALHAGATAVWLDHFDPARVLEAIATHGGTVFMGVPTFYHRLLALPADQGADLSSMRLFTSGSAALPAADHRAFEERYGHAILERYGMTEIGIVLSNPYDGERRPGAVGFPLPGVSARIVDDQGDEVPAGEVGELLIAGPSVFDGYHERPAQTAEVLVDDWMHTGDLARRDADGWYHIAGRKKDLVITGGLNVYPREVEGVLLDHPLVAEVAVYGVPDPDLGERVVATVIGDASLDEVTLLEHARQRLAPYKCPRAVSFGDRLPRNAMGKVQKHRLRERSSHPVVREAWPDEAEHIAGWNVAMARETEDLALDPDAALQGTRAVFEGDVGAFYLRVAIAGKPVGQCMVTREWSDWRAAEVWWIQSVYVDPDHRRQGIYRTLHEAVVERARRAGAAGVRLYVDQRNEAAAETYRRVGMRGDHYRVFEHMFAGEDGPHGP